MKLERRVRALERTIERQQERLQVVIADMLALRAMVVSSAPLIATSSAEQYAALKYRAQDRLTNHLLLAGLSDALAAEASTSLEGMFYEIDAARNEADQPSPRVS